MTKVKAFKLKAEDLVDKYEINIYYSATDACYLAEAPSLEGCITHGDTPEEALANGRDAVLSWLDMSISQSLPIPEPDSKEYSGTLNVRLSKSLHAQLARRAKKEGVSLNHLISQFLAQTLERKRA